jgi:hypothetical protein
LHSLDSAGIDSCFDAFSTNPAITKKLYSSRNTMDYIICMDLNSKSLDSSPDVLRIVSMVNAQKTLKRAPMQLVGGFEAWSMFLLSSPTLKVTDWTEIGDGRGTGETPRGSQVKPSPQQPRHNQPDPSVIRSPHDLVCPAFFHTILF